MPNLIIIRGLPGSGKSTLARSIAEDGYKHFESDMFHMVGSNYCFNPENNRIAHEWCQQNVAFCLWNGFDVVVSNTFTQLWEMEPYLRMPVDHEVIECHASYGNIHNVPEDALKRMAERWEPYYGAEVVA